ncbi:MAG: hypothetical protein JWM48_712 [Mycobacterium sp.]|nr:hypothetical protein [Mycobacterium sp.]
MVSASPAPATVEVVYRYLAAVFRSAVADRLIMSSPCVGVRLPCHSAAVRQGEAFAVELGHVDEVLGDAGLRADRSGLVMAKPQVSGAGADESVCRPGSVPGRLAAPG